MQDFKGSPAPWTVEDYTDEKWDGGYRLLDFPQRALQSRNMDLIPEESEANRVLIEQAPNLLDKAHNLISWLHVTHPETGDVHCLACREVTDPQDVSNGTTNHHQECPVVPMIKAIWKALGKE